MSALLRGQQEAYQQQREAFDKHYKGSTGSDSHGGQRTEMSYSPLLSLAVKIAVDNHDSDSTSEPAITSGFDSANESPSTSSSDDSATEESTATTSSEASSSEGSCVANDVFPQYGLLGFNADKGVALTASIDEDEPILQNTNCPSSAFICGSQGSGKSYTMACMLENCLIKDDRNGVLRQQLPSLVFHYDVDGGNTVAEAVALCSRGIQVQVLVSLSNYWQLEKAYREAAGFHADKLTVAPLLFLDSQMTTKQITRLMAFTEGDGPVPLYMEVLSRIIRDMALENTRFSLARLEKLLKAESLNPGQASMLNMRMDLLKSFLVSGARILKKGKQNFPPIQDRDMLATAPGRLTIVDLSDDAVSASTACVLFDICLGFFMSSLKNSGGYIVALDEAHKFIDKSSQAADLTTGLTTTIREQRHTGARVIVATQEPTISASLLDLCSISIVHRFTSPAWFNAISDHLGAASSLTTKPEAREKLFQDIVQLQQGESFVFSPSSYLCLEAGRDGGEPALRKLGAGILKMKTRMRLGLDAGKSKMATELDAAALPFRPRG